MLSVKRLNLDSSWHISYNNSEFLIDPWLIGSEVDGFKWLNEQWHIKDPVQISELPNYDFILISQNYEDHCHIKTLREFPEDKTLIATEKAYNKLKKEFPKREIILLEDNKVTSYKDLTFLSLRPNKILDPVYYSLVIANNNESIFYAPHGFTLNDKQLKLVNTNKVKLLITTFTEFEIPKIMGGKVNPGMENVYELYNQIKPLNTINTHDEEKKAKGLVSSLAKIKYADFDEIESKNSINFIRIDNYSKKIIT